MTNAQEFNTLSREFCLEQADKVVKECGECFGERIIPLDVLCPKCTPEADKWRKLADGFCWHEDEWYACHTEVCSCCSLQDCPPKKYHKYRPSRNNPTYSNPADIARALKRMGLWDKFTTWLWMKFIPNAELDQYGIFDILTDPALFLSAGTNFLREIVGQS